MEGFLRKDASASSAPSIFLSYTSEDEVYGQALAKHLSPLETQRRIRLWYPDKVAPGELRRQNILEQLNAAQIVLLLISPNFTASPDCNEIMNKALECRQQNSNVTLIPIIVSPVVGWQKTALGQFLALPRRGMSLRDSRWRNLDEACAAVAEDIFQTLEEKYITPVSLPDPRRSQPQYEYIYTFSEYIAEKTQHFVGRHFLFQEMQEFIESNARGYFLLLGDPGIGKSAISAKLVQDHGYIHFFNIRAEGINHASDFLQSISAQLLAAYNLDEIAFPPKNPHNTADLRRLLNAVSEKTGQKGKCVIIIDALDEVEDQKPQGDSNILFLPKMLPTGIFIIATTRRETEDKLRLQTDPGTVLRKRYLAQDEPGNSADIATYLEEQVHNPGIQAYIQYHQIDDELFIDHLREKAQGNFIYLRYVLPEIKRGHYQDFALDELPDGLENYYQNHWLRIRRSHELDWFTYRLPVVLALTVIKKPIPLALILKYAELDAKQKWQVIEVLHDFDQFLYKTTTKSEQGVVTTYRWYHASFFDFIERKDGLVGEKIIMQDANKKIANNMLATWKKSLSARMTPPQKN